MMFLQLAIYHIITDINKKYGNHSSDHEKIYVIRSHLIQQYTLAQSAIHIAYINALVHSRVDLVAVHNILRF